MIKDRILSEFRSINIAGFDEVTEYLAGSFGSFFRSRLIIAMSRLLGTLDETRVLLSASIEILHYATLLHDDVIDGCRYRRNSQSLNSAFGDKTAILTGDMLFGMAGRMVAMCKKPFLYSHVADTVLCMAGSEIEEYLSQGSPETGIDAYLRIIDGKTGSLFGLAFLFASYRGEKADEMFYEKGVEFGRCFQIIDDTKDYMLDFSDNTKPVFNDFSSGTMTYPLLILLRSLKGSDRDFVLQKFGKKTEPGDENYIRKLLQEYRVFGQILQGMEDRLKNIFHALGFHDLSSFEPIINEMLDKVKKGGG